MTGEISGTAGPVPNEPAERVGKYLFSDRSSTETKDWSWKHEMHEKAHVMVSYPGV